MIRLALGFSVLLGTLAAYEISVARLDVGPDPVHSLERN